MKLYGIGVIMFSLLLATTAVTEATAQAKSPISLHPDNPHYFLFRGKPTFLLTSAEHYGAVLNLDFDYLPYFDTLKADKLNLTRIFTGAYVEDPSSFNIRMNTLAPAPGRFICPWGRSATPGYANGGNKFDLTQWDAAYFKRLKDFCQQAGKRGIVVEVVLFCPYYEESQWAFSPLNIKNNVNNIGDVPRSEVNTQKHPQILAVQDALVRKIVAELKDLDNIYYEICNEPYFGGVTLDWQAHIAATIQDAEKSFPHKHLIAQNIANETADITAPNPAVSIFNFHYASPPTAVYANYHLNKVIGFDETGFKGTADATYRQQAWEFMLAGGGVFNNLDYSFTAEHETGIYTYPQTQPGGGSPAYRKQLRILRDFLARFDFLRMKPDPVLAVEISQGAKATVLSGAGKAYALYLHGGKQAELSLELSAGRYQAEWLHPTTGATEKKQTITHKGGRLTLAVPSYTEDIALRLVSR